MSKTVWHSGPPPSIGWWPASCFKDEKSIRWWNGDFWSKPCEATDSLGYVTDAAKQKSTWSELVKWTDRPASWPERSRT